jgi:enolase
MTREELIGSLRSCAELVKEHKLDACAAVMRAAADRMEDEDKFYTLRERDGLTLKYNEETGEWDKYEVYMSVDCQTEEDFAYLKECVEKQQAQPVKLTEDNCFCPNCRFDMMGCYDDPEASDPQYCPECGQ